MKSEVVQFAFVLLVLVVSASAEELLPSFCGVGFPLLLALAMVMAMRTKVLPGVMTAIAAGAFEDALSSLPPMTSVCFFVIAALLARKEYFPRPFLPLLFPLFELWAGLCILGPKDDVFVRMLVSFPLGLAATGGQFLALTWGARRAGVDE